MNIHLHPDELIFHKVGDDIVSAGFGINSVLMRRGQPAILTFTTTVEPDYDDEEGDPTIFKSYKNLAVPFGLFTSTNYKQHEISDAEYIGAIPDDLHDSLLAHATYKTAAASKKRKSAKQNNKSMKKRNKK